MKKENVAIVNFAWHDIPKEQILTKFEEKHTTYQMEKVVVDHGIVPLIHKTIHVIIAVTNEIQTAKIINTCDNIAQYKSFECKQFFYMYLLNQNIYSILAFDQNGKVAYFNYDGSQFVGYCISDI